MSQSVIVSAVRTPIGNFQGALSPFSATELGAVVIDDVIRKGKCKPADVEYCIMGCVLPAGLGQSPARQATLKSTLPPSTQALTINKVCGSGLMSVMIADQMIRCGDHEIVMAGGMESMTNSPYLLPKARNGYRMGNGEIIDSLVNDGLWDLKSNQHMGCCADLCAKENDISRKEQDEFASESYRKALAAIKDGAFKDEIVPVKIPQRKGEPLIFDTDEGPAKVNFEKLPKLKPSFGEDGSVTAANASSINDGAATVLVMSEGKAKKLKLKPLAKIVAHAGFSKDTVEFTTAPVEAIERVLKKAKLKISDIDLFEINEAFSCVVLNVIKKYKLDPKKVNINGGAVALGHPIGASGTRILVTLIHAMRAKGAKFGLATLCIGGGEAVAMIIESVEV
ncbi:MAG: acetyl-CoA C-acetyltransferase [Pseudomonadota bacterium]